MDEQTPFDSTVPPSLDVPTEKTCVRCNKTKPIAKFYRNNALKDGRSLMCALCTKADFKRRYNSGNHLKGKRKVTARLAKNVMVKLEAQPEKVREIVALLIEDPKITWPEIANKTGLTVGTVRQYCYSNGYITAMRRLATHKISSFTPLALSAIKDSLTSNNADVKFRAGVKVLDNEGVLGPDRVDVTITDLRNQSTDKLQELLKQAQAVPHQQIVDAEVIG